MVKVLVLTASLTRLQSRVGHGWSHWSLLDRYSQVIQSFVWQTDLAVRKRPKSPPMWNSPQVQWGQDTFYVQPIGSSP